MKKRLLLADDSITIQKVIQITFSHDDYVMTVVDNGDAALEKARAERPDLVLADVFMPGKNGYELCAAIKQDPALAATPVLLLTGTFEPFDEAKAKSVGADKWIAKPFESQALIACVEELLSRAPQKAAPTVAPQPLRPEAPLAMPQAAPAPQAVASPPVAPVVPAEEDLWGGDFDSGLEPAETIMMSQSERLTAKDEGDLWGGGFDVETPAFENTVASSDELWGNFEEETALGLDPFATTVAPAAAEQDMWGGADDLMSSFTSETPEPIALAEPDSEMALFGDVEILEEIDLSEDFSAAEPFATSNAFEIESFGEVQATAPAVEPSPFLEETMWESEPTFGVEFEEPAAPVSNVKAAPTVAVAPTMTPAGPVKSAEVQIQSLSEAELERVVEKVAGVVIERLAGTVLEKIAWEVVPDLAESMIKEEIRKIRDAATA